MHKGCWGTVVLTVMAACLPLALAAPAEPLPGSSSAPLSGSAPVAATSSEPSLSEVAVTAPEPRYVAPTLRDKLGRIWAPVYLNGKGPFRLVLDTGASHSAVIARVATDLGLPPTGAMMLHGVTGSATVPFITVDTFLVGDLESHAKLLPIVPDALGGADGVLGMENLTEKRIFIDFMHDLITIKHSHSERAPYGYVTIPLVRGNNGLLMTFAYVSGIKVKAIIDTGGQATVANRALLVALQRKRRGQDMKPTTITGATDDVQEGQNVVFPPLTLGPVTVQSGSVAVSDLDIFERWNMTKEPAMLIGIDTLGLVNILIIDYHRMELQIRMRT